MLLDGEVVPGTGSTGRGEVDFAGGEEDGADGFAIDEDVGTGVDVSCAEGDAST